MPKIWSIFGNKMPCNPVWGELSKVNFRASFIGLNPASCRLQRKVINQLLQKDYFFVLIHDENFL